MGSFKSFPLQTDEHLLTVLRYAERNPLRAWLVGRAADWRWGSLWRRERGPAEARALLSEGPVPRPAGWAAWVDASQTAAELERLRRCGRRGQPFGDPAWVQEAARRLGLETTLRSPGRPRKQPQQSLVRS